MTATAKQQKRAADTFAQRYQNIQHVKDRLVLVAKAIGYLKMAREALTDADAKQTLKKVRSALKSAEGAERNAWGRLSRAGTREHPVQISGLRQ